jgi:L-ascorbate metabolism protein UlaG (beta-lactamase superfamily)
MKHLLAIPLTVLAAVSTPPAGGQSGFETDSFDAQRGPLTFTFIGHGSLLMQYGDLVIHVDPVGGNADYSRLPKAGLVLITHDHQDHLDGAALARVRAGDTTVIANEGAARQVEGATVMKNGETREVRGVRIEAVAAYNTTAGRDRFHPRGRDNGYVLALGGRRVYIAGDTEDTPEMRALKGIDIAFLPMNQPYTMTPEQVAAAARAFRPKVLYPYHFGDTDTGRLSALFQGEKGIEVRIRRMQ